MSSLYHLYYEARIRALRYSGPRARGYCAKQFHSYVYLVPSVFNEHVRTRSYHKQGDTILATPKGFLP